MPQFGGHAWASTGGRPAPPQMLAEASGIIDPRMLALAQRRLLPRGSIRSTSLYLHSRAETLRAAVGGRALSGGRSTPTSFG